MADEKDVYNNPFVDPAPETDPLDAPAETPQPELENVPGYMEAPSIDQVEAEATGQQYEPKDITIEDQFEINKKYEGLLSKAARPLGYLHRELVARPLIKYAPQIKEAAKWFAQGHEIDTSDWEPVDMERYELLMQSPEVYGHDFVNLTTSAEKTNPIARAVLATASDFVDPLFGVNNILGTANKFKHLTKAEKAATMGERLKKGEQILANVGGIEIKAPKIGFDLAQKGGNLVKKAGQKINEKAIESINLDIAEKLQEIKQPAERIFYSFVGSTKTPGLQDDILDLNAALKANDIKTGILVRENKKLVENIKPEDFNKGLNAFELGKYGQETVIGKNGEKVVQQIDSAVYPPGTEDAFKWAKAQNQRLNEEKTDFLTELHELYDEAGNSTLRDATGKTKIGFKASPFKETAPTTQEYFPRIWTSEFDNEIRKTMGDASREFIGSTTKDMSRKQRQYKQLTTEVGDFVKGKMNIEIENAKRSPFTGQAFETNPVKAVAIKQMNQGTQVAKMRFAKKASQYGISEQEFKALPYTERVNYVKWGETPQSIKATKTATERGAKDLAQTPEQLLQGKYYFKPDADRIKYALGVEPLSKDEKALNTVGTAMRFWRNATLFGPTYHFGNQFGNMMQASLALNPKQVPSLFKNFYKSIKEFKQYSKGKKEVFSVAGELHTPNSWVEELASRGLFETSGIGELASKESIGESMVRSLNQSKLEKIKDKAQSFNLFKMNREITELYADNAWKSAMYKTLLEGGYTKDAAAELTSQALFRFDNVGPAFDQVRKLVPFRTHGALMLSTYLPRLIAKHPWLPEAYDRFEDLYTKQNISEDPLEAKIFKQSLPWANRATYNPVTSQLLAGKNLLTIETLQAFNTIGAVLSMNFASIPGAEDFMLLGLGRDPEKGSKEMSADNVYTLESEKNNMVSALGQKLFFDAIPKPVRFALNQVNPEWATSPYGAKVLEKMNPFSERMDDQDQEFGRAITGKPGDFVRKFMPDFFEEYIEKQDPEFFRHVGSIARQHMKDVTLGLARLTNPERDAIMRNSIANTKQSEIQKKMNQILIVRDAQNTPSYHDKELRELEGDLENILKTKRDIGVTLDLLEKLEQKHGKIEDAFDIDRDGKNPVKVQENEKIIIPPKEDDLYKNPFKD